MNLTSLLLYSRAHGLPVMTMPPPFRCGHLRWRLHFDFAPVSSMSPSIGAFASRHYFMSILRPFASFPVAAASIASRWLDKLARRQRLERHAPL
jgi:hypothetical protein